MWFGGVKFFYFVIFLRGLDVILGLLSTGKFLQMLIEDRFRGLS
jgi:hypothetical protein